MNDAKPQIDRQYCRAQPRTRSRFSTRLVSRPRSARRRRRRGRGLDGKTVYLVDCRFDDSIELLKQVQGWFAEHMPSGEDQDRLAVGNLSARRSQDLGRDQGERRTPRSSASAIAAPARRVSPPTPSRSRPDTACRRSRLHTDKFDRVVASVTKMAGLPEARARFRAAAGHGQRRADELSAYVYGKDPLTGRSGHAGGHRGAHDRAERVSMAEFDRSSPRLRRAGYRGQSPATVSREQLDRRASDRLADREARRRHAGGDQPQARRGRRPHAGDRVPRAWEYTVEKVAVNAVMAGARPGIFPVILALAASEMSARGSTSSSASAMVVVNGPIRHEIRHELPAPARWDPTTTPTPPSAAPTACCSQNLQGGSEPGVTFMGSQGNSYTYNNLTFAENEERSPWEPLHVQKGFKPTDSTVSIFYGCRSTTFCLGPAREILARARARHAHRHRRQLGAVPAARSAHGATVHRPRRLRHQGEAHPLGARDRADAGRPLLGSAARAELRLSLGDLRQGADGDLAQGQGRRADQPFSRRARSTWSWSAARPTAIGGSWARDIARPCRSTRWRLAIGGSVATSVVAAEHKKLNKSPAEAGRAERKRGSGGAFPSSSDGGARLQSCNTSFRAPDHWITDHSCG